MTEEFDPKVYLQQGAWRDVRLGLHRTEELLERLGRPQDRLRIVHVAGTNGKGSTCAFTAGILQAAGYKVGLFTSPYVLRFNERIQVNREDISDEDLLAVALEVREAAEQMDEQPTAFELITAAALLHFATELYPYRDYRFLGGHYRQADPPYSKAHNPVCMQMVEDMIRLCDEMLAGRAQDAVFAGRAFGDEQPHIASCGTAAMVYLPSRVR